jgi:hypothetical protein
VINIGIALFFLAMLGELSPADFQLESNFRVMKPGGRKLRQINGMDGLAIPVCALMCLLHVQTTFGKVN